MSLTTNRLKQHLAVLGLPTHGQKSETQISPRVVGFWPLGQQNTIAARDISGNGNHFLSVNGGMVNIQGTDGWLKNAGAATGRLRADPLDMCVDIGAPGVSFISAWETRAVALTGTQDQTVLAKGQTGSGGQRGLGFGMLDNGASAVRMRIMDNNTSRYSSNFPTWYSNRIYHVAVVRDSTGVMGTANRIYVYIDGVRDTAFNTTGYLDFAPTSQFVAANLALVGYGNNVTGSDLGSSGANNHTLRNLQLALCQPDIPLLSLAGMDALIADMATSPTYILQHGDLS